MPITHLSQVTYTGFTYNPETLPLPNLSDQPPLPNLHEPNTLPHVEETATRNHEPLTQIRHPRIRTLNTYYHTGWDNTHPETWARETVTQLLYQAVETLPHEFGFAIFDAYRPLTLQQEIYTAAYTDPTLPAGFVTPPNTNPATPPPHTTGGTIDLTLTWQGHPLALGSPFDDFTPQAHTRAYETTPGVIRDCRRLLYWTLNRVGFRVLDCEWWHYEYGTPRWAALTGNQPQYRGTHLYK